MTDDESGTPTTRDLVHGLAWVLGTVIAVLGVIGLVLAATGFFDCGCTTPASPA